MNYRSELLADQYIVTHSVGQAQTGLRLDAFLKDRYQRRSRERLKRDIGSGIISIQRTHSPHMQVGRIKASTLLQSGDEVRILTEKKPEPPVRFNYDTLFEDPVIQIVNKPAPLPVHPAGKYFFHTLLTHLRTNGFTEPLRLDRQFYLVHRIDKETSGVLILSKDRSICTALTEQFRDRLTQKSYLAIVRGHPQDREFLVDIPIGRSRTSKIALKMDALPVHRGGQVAETRFEVLRPIGDYSLLRCFPKTGRQHQIRIHLQLAGFPILGDKLYSLKDEEALRFFEPQNIKNPHGKVPQMITPEMRSKLILDRQALHAASIEFEHPIQKKRLRFEAPLPSDLQEFISQFDEPGAGLLRRDPGRVSLNLAQERLNIRHAD